MLVSGRTVAVADAYIYLALVQGATLAGKLGQAGDAYSGVAPQVLCFLQQFWVASPGFINSNSKTSSLYRVAECPNVSFSQR